MINEVREITDKYTELGIPCYVTGIPFYYWEQYVGLVKTIWEAIGFSLGAAFLLGIAMLFLVRPECNNKSGTPSTISALVSSVWGSFMIVFTVTVSTFLVYGFSGFFLKFNAIPAVSLIMSVGVAVEFTAHFTLIFVNSMGTRRERTVAAINHMLTPMLDGAMTTFLGILMIGASEFRFIIQYYFLLYLLIIVFAAASGLLLLPVLLSLVGPPQLTYHRV